MDRSFLSDAAVIAASRSFVCARLATYEDETENRFLKTLFRTGSGELENTVFAMFAPDGREKLVRSGRGPQNVFRNAGEMAKRMTEIAASYKLKPVDPPALPIVASVPLGLMISAADNRPLAILMTPATDQNRLVAKLAPIAWSDDQIGRFNFAIAEKADDLKSIRDATFEAGIIVVQPDPFGREGKILAKADRNGDWNAALNAGVSAFARADQSQRNHIRAGREAGVFYEPKTPVTDPMENRARERNRPKP